MSIIGMRKGLNFRQKIILSHILLFLAFILFSFPFIEKTVRRVVLNNLQINSCDLIEKLQKAKDQDEMILQLKGAENFIFLNLCLFDQKGTILYHSLANIHNNIQNSDSEPSDNPTINGSEAENTQALESFNSAQTQILINTGHKSEVQNIRLALPISKEEIFEAIQKGTVFSVRYSPVFHMKLAYVAIPFVSQDLTYVLVSAIPFAQVEDFTDQFKVWFFAFSALALLFFGSVTWLIFHRINFPIQQIIKAIKPYQGGREEVIPHIELNKTIDEEDDFFKLAQTLNSLSARLRLQIKNITDERNEKEAILESLGEGVIAVDAEMKIRYVNFIGSKMLGVSRRQLLGNTFPLIKNKPSSQLLEKCYSIMVACQEKLLVMTDSILIGESTKVYLDLIAAPKAQRNGAILVMQDKSSHYKVLEMGKDFVANASHELRTPITIIKGFAETLQDLPELPRDMVVDITEKIVRNCQRMDNLVKNLLTLADLENLPESRFQDCDAVSLVEACRNVVNSVYDKAQITLEKNREAIMIAADPDFLELAIINLLDNAAKYSNPPAQINVSLKQESDEVVIHVHDKGIGIPPADLEHIFERFYTVDKARSRRLGGAGLGLSIVRTIIERHHGNISVSSIVGVGTTFTISLPIH